MERSRPEISTDMIIDKGIINNNQSKFCPYFTFIFKIDMGPPKTKS